MSDLDSELLFPKVEEVVKNYAIRNLVETGTGPRASGLLVAERLGLAGFSCDISAVHVANARERFPQFKIHHCESLAFLKWVLPYLGGPTFFWLDAHCNTEPESMPAPEYPAFNELRLIMDWLPEWLNVIWMDDMQFYVSDNILKVEV